MAANFAGGIYNQPTAFDFIGPSTIVMPNSKITLS
jgi:hypothetical protein